MILLARRIGKSSAISPPILCTLLCLSAFLVMIPSPAGKARGSDSSVVGGGTVAGHVEIKTVLKEVTRQRGRRYRARGSPEVEARLASESAEPEISAVVVYLEEIGEKRSYSPPSQPATLLQEGKKFVPHVLPVVRGTSVQIVNRDDYYHNVFSNSSVKRFNIGRQVTKKVVTETFDKAGFVPVFCDIHLEMSAYVLVFENPFFAKPDANGDYVIHNVPGGKYRVVTWHERLLSQSQEITIREDGTVTVDFTL